MFVREHLGRVVRRIADTFGAEDDNLPDGIITIAAKAMAEIVQREGEKAWSGYRLIGFQGSPHIEVAYEAPVITDVHYLEMGEGDAPTIYISTVDDPYHCFPCSLGESVLLLPRESETAS
jgi:hypothetical protein